jgi:hypothetical protein
MFVDAFLANYAAHADFAKPSKFAVLMFQPPGLTLSGGLFGGLIGQNKLTEGVGKAINTASMTFQVEQAVLPGYQINTTEQRIFGAPFTQAATPIFEPFQLSILCAGDMWERKFIEDWMELILPREPKKFAIKDLFNADSSGKRPPFTAAYREQYCSTIEVVQFHDTGIPSVRYKFEEAFPVDMNPQQLNWGDNDIHRLVVTFHYRTYRREENILKQIWSEFRPRVGTVELGNLVPL